MKQVHTLERSSFDYRVIKLVDEYYKSNFNRIHAMEAVGFASGAGYADRLFKHPKVVAEIEKRQKRLRKRMNVTEEDVINQIKRLAFGNDILSKYIMVDPEDGSPYWDFRGAPKEDLALISSIVKDKKGTLKVSTYDVLNALGQLTKVLGLSREKLEVTGKDGEPLTAVNIDEVVRKMAFLLNSAAAKQEEAE